MRTLYGLDERVVSRGLIEKENGYIIQQKSKKSPSCARLEGDEVIF
ncbi:hypothetical protein GCM10007906_14840 [Vibrio hyugaensis]|uniref:Transposase n=1 Tax=Vibrio hyugaensis TaxID=1534743 RepID=A0ABQ5Y011_9VIBR|nr:hypothetical protein GCM10007906_14840 [Vibrio hyugaensis]